jgi:PQQ-like domain
MTGRLQSAALIALTASASIALASCTGGGSGGGSPGSVGPGAAPPTTQPAGQWQALSAQGNAVGAWSYGDTVVVAANTQVTAYNQNTGKVIWRTQAPPAAGRATVFCGASQSKSGATVVLGIGVAADSTGVGSDCHSVVSLSLTTGRLGWLQQLPSAAEQTAYARSLDGHLDLAQKGLVVEVSGQTVVAGWLGVIAGFSLTSGTRLWTAGIDGSDSPANFTKYVVKDIAFSGAGTYIAAAEVYPEAMKLLRLDTATGKVSREVTLSKRKTGLDKTDEATILSAVPLTVAVGQLVPLITNIVIFRSDLAASRVLPGGPQLPADGAIIGKTLYASPLNGNNDAHEFYPLALGNGLLVAATLAPDSGGQGNPLVAFNDTTSDMKWTTTVPGTDIVYPVSVTGSAVEVVGVTQSGQGNPVLISMDAATGKVLSVGQPRVLGPAPLGQAVAYYRFISARGHVYAVYWSSSKTTPGSVPAVFTLG